MDGPVLGGIPGRQARQGDGVGVGLKPAGWFSHLLAARRQGWQAAERRATGSAGPGGRSGLIADKFLHRGPGSPGETMTAAGYRGANSAAEVGTAGRS